MCCVFQPVIIIFWPFSIFLVDFLCFSVIFHQKTTLKMVENNQKEYLSSFWVHAAPESWSKYTAGMFGYYFGYNKNQIKLKNCSQISIYKLIASLVLSDSGFQQYVLSCILCQAHICTCTHFTFLRYIIPCKRSKQGDKKYHQEKKKTHSFV